MVWSNIPDWERKRVTANACSSGQGVVRLQLCERWNFAAKTVPYAPTLSEGHSEGSFAANCICRLSCATRLSVEESHRSTLERRSERATAVLVTVIKLRVGRRGDNDPVLVGNHCSHAYRTCRLAARCKRKSFAQCIVAGLDSKRGGIPRRWCRPRRSEGQSLRCQPRSRRRKCRSN